jgi:hypothetical protein
VVLVLVAVAMESWLLRDKLLLSGLCLLLPTMEAFVRLLLLLARMIFKPGTSPSK